MEFPREDEWKFTLCKPDFPFVYISPGGKRAIEVYHGNQRFSFAVSGSIWNSVIVDEKLQHKLDHHIQLHPSYPSGSKLSYPLNVVTGQIASETEEGNDIPVLLYNPGIENHLVLESKETGKIYDFYFVLCDDLFPAFHVGYPRFSVQAQRFVIPTRFPFWQTVSKRNKWVIMHDIARTVIVFDRNLEIGIELLVFCVLDVQNRNPLGFGVDRIWALSEISVFPLKFIL
jgi:hypothetical protein